MLNDKAKTTRYGLSLRSVIILMFVVGVVVSAFLLVSMYQTTARYNDVETATHEYIACQENVYLIRDAINTLFEDTQDFVITGNTDKAILYFNEVQVERTRELAIEEIKKYVVSDQTLKHLNTAVRLSDQMMETQWYAMRLAIEGYGYDINKYPAALRDVELNESDLALSQAEQLAQAREMLFAKNYLVLKEQVGIRIELCKNQLIAAMDARHEESSNELEELLRRQQGLIIALVITLLLTLIFVITLVVNPITQLIRGIREGRNIALHGSSEIKFLTNTYNNMYDSMEETNLKLSYEAAHDALTGLYNRSAYEELREESKHKNIALLVVDVDYFKHINDTYGHDIGDKVLVRVAQVLTDSFRDADKVCRIGGDEFSVIMMDVTSSLTEVIRRKIQTAAETLSTAKENIPPVTLSVGCAFSDTLKENESLFKNADKALYSVKQKGRNGCAFYPVSE